MSAPPVNDGVERRGREDDDGDVGRSPERVGPQASADAIVGMTAGTSNGYTGVPRRRTAMIPATASGSNA
jgi:hypothetical protein